MSDFLTYFILGLTRGSMYALIALGYTLVYGVLQLINFAHSEVFMSGAFGSYLVIGLFVHNGDILPWYGVIAVLILGLASGAAVGAFVAWTLERVAYRPLRRRGHPSSPSSSARSACPSSSRSSRARCSTASARTRSRRTSTRTCRS